MKKIELCAAIAAAITFAGCVKWDGNVGNRDNGKVLVSLVADMSSTRADITDPANPTWDDAESIGVFTDSGEKNVEFIGDISPDNLTAVFSGELNLSVGQNTVYAYHTYQNEDGNFYYPDYNDGSETPDHVALSIPGYQRPRLTSFDPQAALVIADPLVVEYDGVNTPTFERLKFNHMTAVLKVTPVGDIIGLMGGERVTNFQMEVSGGSDDFKLAGVTYFDLTDPAGFVYPPNDYDEEEGRDNNWPEYGKDIYAHYDESINLVIDGTSSIYLCTVPGTITAGMSVKFTIQSATHIFEKTVAITSNFELLQGKINTMRVSFNASHEERATFSAVESLAEILSTFDANDWIIAAITPTDALAWTTGSYLSSSGFGSYNLAPYYNRSGDYFSGPVRRLAFCMNGISILPQGGGTYLIRKGPSGSWFSLSSNTSPLWLMSSTTANGTWKFTERTTIADRPYIGIRSSLNTSNNRFIGYSNGWFANFLESDINAEVSYFPVRFYRRVVE